MHEFRLRHALAKALGKLPPGAQRNRSGWTLQVPRSILDAITWERAPRTAIWGLVLEPVDSGFMLVSPTGSRYEIRLSDERFDSLDYLDTIQWQDKDLNPADPPVYESEFMSLITSNPTDIVSAWSGTTTRGEGAGAVQTADHRVVSWKPLPREASSEDIHEEIMGGVSWHDSRGHAALAWKNLIDGIA